MTTFIQKYMISSAKRMMEVLLYKGKGNICFLHIPKCGGTSIVHAIRKHYLFSNVQVDTVSSFQAAKVLYSLDNSLVNDYYYVLKVRESVLLYFMSQNIRFISGHFSFSNVAYSHFQDTYRFITLLRHPVKRWISHYFYNRYKTDNDHCNIEEDLATYIQSEDGYNIGHLYVKMIGGLDKSGDYVSQQAINRAKENLHKFMIVGCLEDLGDFIRVFEQKFGMKLHIRKKNLNPKALSYIHSVVTKDIEEEITRLCQPDLEVYHYARHTFQNL